MPGHSKTRLGVKVSECLRQAKTAVRDFAQPAPFPRRDAEDVLDEFLCRSLAFPADTASVLVFHFRSPPLQFPPPQEDPWENIPGSKPAHADGHWVWAGARTVPPVPHDGTNMPRREEGLDAIVGRAEDGLH